MLISRSRKSWLGFLGHLNWKKLWGAASFPLKWIHPQPTHLKKKDPDALTMLAQLLSEQFPVEVILLEWTLTVD